MFMPGNNTLKSISYISIEVPLSKYLPKMLPPTGKILNSNIFKEILNSNI